MTIGTVIASLLVFAWSRVVSLPMLYVIFAALGMTSSATFYDPAFTAVAVWFKRDRSRALLIITLVAGLASTIATRFERWVSTALTSLSDMVCCLSVVS